MSTLAEQARKGKGHQIKLDDARSENSESEERTEGEKIKEKKKAGIEWSLKLSQSLRPP